MDAHQYSAYATLLDYPAAAGPLPLPASASPVVGEMIEQFNRQAEALGLGRLEESYAQLFDLQPECTLNLSHHLFANDEWKRSAMLIELKTLFNRHGLGTGSELPDHLCWLLRLLAAAPAEDEEVGEVRTRLLLPALRQLHARVRNEESPYPLLLQALYLELQGEAGA